MKEQIIKPAPTKATQLGFVLYTLTSLIFFMFFANHLTIQNALYIPLAFLAAAFVTDFVSGIFHIYFDYRHMGPLQQLFDKGKYVLVIEESNDYPPNSNLLDSISYVSQVHHKTPTLMTNHNFLTLNKEIIWASLFSASTSILVLNISVSISFFLFSFSFLLLLTRYFHMFCHSPPSKVPTFFRFLQAKKIIISRKNHAQHHFHFDKNFCILSGWANPIVNLIFKLWKKGPS